MNISDRNNTVQIYTIYPNWSKSVDHCEHLSELPKAHVVTSKVSDIMLEKSHFHPNSPSVFDYDFQPEFKSSRPAWQVDQRHPKCIIIYTHPYSTFVGVRRNPCCICGWIGWHAGQSTWPLFSSTSAARNREAATTRAHVVLYFTASRDAQSQEPLGGGGLVPRGYSNVGEDRCFVSPDNCSVS